MPRKHRRRVTRAERGADKRVMSIVPGGFDEHAAQMAVAGLGDRSLRAFGAAGVLRGDKADKSHDARRGGKAPRVAELGGDGECRQIVDPAEAAQSLDAWAQRLEIEQGPQVLFNGAEPRDRFVDGAQVGVMRVIERRERPGLRAQPGIVPF